MLPSMLNSTLQEIILHTLFESGITRINDLERYIKDDVVRYGGRLSELEKKLGNAYREAVSLATGVLIPSPVLMPPQTTEEAWDDEALFRMEDEEEDGEFVTCVQVVCFHHPVVLTT